MSEKSSTDNGWKKATVNKPPKARSRKLAVFAAALVAGAVIVGAAKSHIKLPDFAVSAFKTAISKIDTNEIKEGGTLVEKKLENFAIYNQEEAQAIVDAVEEGYKEKEENVKENTQEEVIETEEDVFDKLSFYEGTFELPVEGSTGIVGNKRISFTDENSNETVKLDRGETYTIIAMSEDEKTFTIATADGNIGEISTQDAWINLPDIIPSIVYKVSNNESALYKSQGQDIPGITGESLYEEKAGYNAYGQNDKLGREEYVVPVDFDMAKKIQAVQKTAMEHGYTLIIYETFRPFQVQKAVAENLRKVDTHGQSLSQFLNAGNNTSYDQSWFIAQGRSNHQYAGAMDCSLALENAETFGISGDYKYVYHTESDYIMVDMPTEMHELSANAAIFKYGVSSGDRNAWKNAPLKESFEENIHAMALQKFCTENGLTPLSSEWWHFNDPDSLQKQRGRLTGNDSYGVGEFAIGNCMSTANLSIYREMAKDNESLTKHETGSGNIEVNESTNKQETKEDDFERD